jgi:tRNA(Ile)-lysidine synthase
MAMLLTKIEQTIRKYDLIQPGDKVLVALSGGPDSASLFHLLNLLAPKFNFSIAAAHIDHGLRKSSITDQKFCAALCQFHQVRFFSKTANIAAIAKRRHLGIEECGRLIRYKYFEQICLKYGYNKIATGHTADDCVETFLLHLIRGANLGGLSGIQSKRGNIIRPLIECDKSELIAFLKQNGLSFRVDKSNYDDAFRRNLLRNKIIPQLKKINPAAAKHIVSAAESIGKNYSLIQQIVDEVFRQCLVEQSPDQIILDLTGLSGYFEPLGSWVFLKAYSQLTGDYYRPDSDTIARVLKLKRNGTSIALGANLIVMRHADKLVLMRPVKRFALRSLKIGQIAILGSTGMAIVSEVIKKGNLSEIFNNRDENYAFLDFAKIGNLEVRNLKAGDKFKPLGMSGTKKVVDFLNERGVPKQVKTAVPLVVTSGKIAWVAGFGIADDFKVTKDTRTIIKLRLLKNEQSSGIDF